MLKDLKITEQLEVLKIPEDTFTQDLEQFIDLGQGLNGKKEYEYKGKKVEVKGIPEDFKIFLNGELVVAVCYDDFYQVNVQLAAELLY